MNRRQFALALAMTPGIGGRTTTRVLTRHELLGREPEEFFKLPEVVLREEYQLTKKQAANLIAEGDPREALAPLEARLEKLGVRWVTLADANYPERIEAFDPDPPGVLFLYGNLKLLGAKTFTVLTSRDARPAAQDRVERLAEEGVLDGEVLVGGAGNLGYQRASVVPLRYGAPRILGLDRGLFPALGDDLKQELFPAARLWRYEFDPRTDLVVSPFRPFAEYAGVNNQVRDRLVASLSLRLDFVEISPAGNMEKLLLAAIKAGRPTRVSDLSLDYRRYREAGAEILSF